MTAQLNVGGVIDEDGVVTIDLTVPCDLCEGRGVLADFEAKVFTECDARGCNGGYVITPSGQDIIRFVRGWMDHPSVEMDF